MQTGSIPILGSAPPAAPAVGLDALSPQADQVISVRERPPVSPIGTPLSNYRSPSNSVPEARMIAAAFNAPAYFAPSDGAASSAVGGELDADEGDEDDEADLEELGRHTSAVLNDPTEEPDGDMFELEMDVMRRDQAAVATAFAADPYGGTTAFSGGAMSGPLPLASMGMPVVGSAPAGLGLTMMSMRGPLAGSQRGPLFGPGSGVLSHSPRIGSHGVAPMGMMGAQLASSPALSDSAIPGYSGSPYGTGPILGHSPPTMVSPMSASGPAPAAGPVSSSSAAGTGADGAPPPPPLLSSEHPFGEHPSRTLFIRNISSSVDDAELRALFEPYGPIRSMYTACKHRGFVMISYYDLRHANNAKSQLQGRMFRRRRLDIHYSIPKENASERDQNQGTLVVFNLDPSLSMEDLRALFSVFGEVKEIRETPNKRHHKFVEFFDIRDAEKAMRSLNKTEVMGKKIKIEPSRPGGVRRSQLQGDEDEPPASPPPGALAASAPLGSTPPTPSRPLGPPPLPLQAPLPPPHPPHAVPAPPPGLLFGPLPLASPGSLGSTGLSDRAAAALHLQPAPGPYGPVMLPEPAALSLPSAPSYGPLTSPFGSPMSSFSTQPVMRSPPMPHRSPSPLSAGELLPAAPAPSYATGGLGSPSKLLLHGRPRAESDVVIAQRAAYEAANAALAAAAAASAAAAAAAASGSGGAPVPGGATAAAAAAAAAAGSRRRSASVTDDNRQAFVLDVMKVKSGEDTRCTLMIRNIPNKYTQKMLLQAIDEHHRGTYDFFYLPIDFKNKCNVGYAFINFLRAQHVLPFYQNFHNKRWDKFNSEKVCEITYARIQGKSALIAHFQNSSLLSEDKKCRPILFRSDGPNAGDPEPFPVPMPIGRPRRGSRGDDRRPPSAAAASAAAASSAAAIGSPQLGSSPAFAPIGTPPRALSAAAAAAAAAAASGPGSPLMSPAIGPLGGSLLFGLPSPSSASTSAIAAAAAAAAAATPGSTAPPPAFLGPGEPALGYGALMAPGGGDAVNTATGGVAQSPLQGFLPAFSPLTSRSALFE